MSNLKGTSKIQNSSILAQDSQEFWRIGSGKKWAWDECRSTIKSNSLFSGSQPVQESDPNKGKPDKNESSNDNSPIINFNSDPCIVLTNPLKNNEEEPELKMIIEMERNFLLDEGSQWTWHKSWNLPNISITLDIKDKESGEALLPPQNLYAKIFAVKKELEDQEPQINSGTMLFDVGLKGNEEKQLVNSYAIFSGLKFKTTSYNHEGSPFYLVISVYYGSIFDKKPSTDEINAEKGKKNGPVPFENPKVLVSKISPPLYINSRKLAKETSSKKYHTVIEPFDLQAVEQDLFIRSNKLHHRQGAQTQTNNGANEEKISSDIYGLINYFSAPNIRNKIRHPVFLALKFQDCVKIFYNPKKIEDVDQRQITIKLHKEMKQEFSFGTLTNTQMQAMQEATKTDQANSLKNVKFICYINIATEDDAEEEKVEDINFSEEYRKRLIENNFDLMNGFTIQVATDINLIPKYFLPLDNLEEMKNAVTQDMEGNNLSQLLNQIQKRTDRDEIADILGSYDEEQIKNPLSQINQNIPHFDMPDSNKFMVTNRTLPGLDNLATSQGQQVQQMIPMTVNTLPPSISQQISSSSQKSQLQQQQEQQEQMIQVQRQFISQMQQPTSVINARPRVHQIINGGIPQMQYGMPGMFQQNMMLGNNPQQTLQNGLMQAAALNMLLTMQRSPTLPQNLTDSKNTAPGGNQIQKQ